MKIRHAGEPLRGLPIENTFVAFDELENRLGSAGVEPRRRDQLIPDRPLEFAIWTEGQPQALDALLGAATTRALMLHRENPDLRARIYSECDPKDDARLASLRLMGFKPDDSLMRMRRGVVGGPIIARLPAGLTAVCDRLDDAEERAYFLARYALLFEVQQSEADAWLQAASHRPNFARHLLVSGEGLAGELICWAERGEGVIGLIYTAPAWRRRGVGGYLMELARLHFYQGGLLEVRADIRQRLSPAVRLAASAGYRQRETLMMYPGIDL